MKTLKWFGISISAVLGLISLIYFLGPVPEFEMIEPNDLPILDLSIGEMDHWLKVRNDQIEKLKPENGSFIQWVDSIPTKTRYSVVYLHGFSASPMEGNPFHRDFAKRYGMNLYVPLLPGHGVADPESFFDLTPVEFIESAKEAMMIGHVIGDSVLIMSCSTGGTLSLYLAAIYPEKIHSLLLYAPNIELYNPAAKLLTGPWGLELTHLIQGKYRSFDSYKGTETDKYWTISYRTEGLIALQNLIDQTMTDELLKNISIPYFAGYYYKSDGESDHTISVQRILEFDKLSSTPSKLKQVVAFPEVGEHVIISNIKSKDLESVKKATYSYVENVLGLQPQ